jgi:hypothetical protein
MPDQIPRFELDVLRWHREMPRAESLNFDRRDAQLWLATAGFLTRSEQGLFSITTKGARVLASCK